MKSLGQYMLHFQTTFGEKGELGNNDLVQNLLRVKQNEDVGEGEEVVQEEQEDELGVLCEALLVADLDLLHDQVLLVDQGQQPRHEEVGQQQGPANGQANSFAATLFFFFFFCYRSID